MELGANILIFFSEIVSTKDLRPYVSMLTSMKHMCPRWYCKFEYNLCFHLFTRFLTVQDFFQVALNLLSEREKDELVQLVDTMVSYSVTYRNTKFAPQERANISVVPHDVPSLSLYPPISDVINFKVCLIF